jgi:hypothetical protein
MAPEKTNKKTNEKTKSPTPTEPEAKAEGELRDADLQKVLGGSQASGAGAGKINFNPFSITKKTDKPRPTSSEPPLFRHRAARGSGHPTLSLLPGVYRAGIPD